MSSTVFSSSLVNWLTGVQLERYIKHNANADTKRIYLGIFAFNTLPRKIHKYPLLLIVNSDTDNLPGRHWRAVYISQSLHGEVFDSLAYPVSIALEKWLNSFTLKWKQTNDFYIQFPLSPSCGAFVLHFVLNRLGANSLEHYLRCYFSTDIFANERMIKRYMYALKK